MTGATTCPRCQQKTARFDPIERCWKCPCSWSDRRPLKIEQELWIVHLPEGPVLSQPWIMANGRGAPGMVSFPVTVLRPGQVVTLSVVEPCD